MTFTDTLLGLHRENLTFSVDISSFLSPNADTASLSSSSRALTVLCEQAAQ